MAGYTYFHHMDWGWGILMMFGWLVLLGLVVGVVFFAVRDRRSPSPRELLDRRLASGEIDVAEYEGARAAMKTEGAGGSPAGPPAPA
jgi:uncharacterized membrane protein